MSEQDHDSRPSDDAPVPSDADLVLDPQIDDVPPAIDEGAPGGHSDQIPDEGGPADDAAVTDPPDEAASTPTVPVDTPSEPAGATDADGGALTGQAAGSSTGGSGQTAPEQSSGAPADGEQPTTADEPEQATSLNEADGTDRTAPAERSVPTEDTALTEVPVPAEETAPEGALPDEPAPIAETTPESTPTDEPAPAAAPEPAATGHADSAADKAALAAMWAAVRDRSAAAARPAEPTPAAPAAPGSDAAAGPASPTSEEVPPADDAPVLTGEEVSLSSAEADTADIVGDDTSTSLDTSQIEPVALPRDSEHGPRIPAIPRPVEGSPADEPPATPTSPSVSGAAHDAPATPAAAPEPDDPRAAAPPDILDRHLGRSAPAPVDATAEPAPEAPAPEASEPAPADEPAESDTTQTFVRRRSLVTPTSPAPVEEAETAWRPRAESAAAPEPPRPSTTPSTLDDAIFEGTTVVPEVPRRTAAHVWGLILTLILTPLAWYLLADAGARMTLATDSPMTTGAVNMAAVLELLGGLLVGALLILLAIRSSLGAQVVGALIAVVGAPWVAAPGWTADLVLPFMEKLVGWNTLGGNIAHHLQASGYSGRLLVLGLALLLVGFLSHRVRRVGRAEEATRAQVERVNPEGAYLTARERRRAAKAAKAGARH